MAEEDSQRLKKITANSYAYEGDNRWDDYWSNILIPPNMASRPDVITHFKHKFYQKYIDPELVVEPMASTVSSRSTSASQAPRTSSPSPATEQVRPQNAGSRPSNPTSTRGQLRWDPQSIQFSINAWVLAVTMLAILPLPRAISVKAYRLSLLGTAISSAFSLYSLYGMPRALNLQAAQVWLQSVVATKDFIFLVYCLIFFTSQAQIKFALIPVLCRALEHTAKFMRRNFNRLNWYRKFLDEPCIWVESNTTTLSILCSNAEIGLGFLLVISLFSSQRSIMHTFLYWQLLKLMYYAPVTAGYHQSGWAKLGRFVNPYVNRYAPFLNGPIAAAQRWWRAN